MYLKPNAGAFEGKDMGNAGKFHMSCTKNVCFAWVLGMDWSHWRFGVSDWVYEPGSKEHGVSNLSKHIAPRRTPMSSLETA